MEVSNEKHVNFRNVTSNLSHSSRGYGGRDHGGLTQFMRGSKTIRSGYWYGGRYRPVWPVTPPRVLCAGFNRLRFILLVTHYREKMDHMDDCSNLHLIEEFINEAFEEDESTCDDDASAVVEVSHTPRLSIQPERTETFVSLGGTKYWIPYVSDDVKLSVGDGFPSSEAADIAYRKYEDEAGFNVRQSNRKKNKYGLVQTRYLLCSRQGVSEKKDHDTMDSNVTERKVRNSNFKRTGCKACIKFRFRKEDRSFVVYKFEERHNHVLYSNVDKRFSRGQRQLQYTDYHNIYNATRSSIGGSKAHNIQSALRGGVENVSASIQDYKNASRDMIAFIGIWRHNLVRCDLSNKQVAYETCFILFTIMHAMNFVPFIAIDNHKRSVVVGSALISTEDGDNFTWVLNAFIKAHGKKPRFVIMDQCLGMKEAIPTVTISKDAYVAFKKRINKLVWSTHIDATYFEEEWQRTLVDFGLESHEWLSDIYEIRESWISGYYKDDPMSSLMRTTSRSENSHAYFRLFASFKNDLVRFMRAYDGSIKKQRNKHACLELATRNTFPRCFSPLGIERHASELYTRVVFLDVQKEIRKSIYFCGLSFLCQEGDVKKYSVSHKKKNLSTKASYEVLHDVKVDRHTCECNMFVRVGLICRHIFKVLMNDDKIPEHFICKRWTRALIPVQVQAARARYGEVDMEKESLINVMYADFDLISCKKRNEYVCKVLETLSTMKVKYGASFFANNPVKDKAEAIKECYGMDASADPEIMPAAGIRNKGCSRGKCLIGALEKAVEKNKRPLRMCRVCFHHLYHFIKDHVEKGTIELYFVNTEYQLADLFTKPLDEKRFNFLISKLG
ncbi:LOW QUALITY PROTEIN: hypothetical protein OSB04_010954, partial [Centaurea solstitialis]